VLEAEEVESLGLPLSQFLTLLGRVAAEADQLGLRRVQRQFERAHSFLQVVQESLRLMLMLKANNAVIRIAGLREAPPSASHLRGEDVAFSSAN